MSDVVGIEKITDRAGTGAPDFTNGFNINGSDSGISGFAHTESANEPSSPSNGDAWLDTDNNIYKVYINGEWKDWLGTTAPTGNAWNGSRALVAGSNFSANDNVIQYFDITSAGNASDFGDLTADAKLGSAAGSSARTIFAKIATSSSNSMDYVSAATLGNAQDFGNLNYSMDYTGSVSDGSRKVTGSKDNSGAMGYVSIDTTGNATSFGNLSTSNWWANNGPACGNNGTYGIFAGSQNGSSAANEIQYITIQSAGNASNFGGLSVSRDFFGFQSCSDATRTVMGGGIGGGSHRNTIDYITTANTGNATDFGDLTQEMRGVTGTSNSITAVWCGGYHNTNYSQNVIQSVTIQTAGNATDFGDLLTAANEQMAGSGAAS